jgi:hypothetical protein
VIDVLAVSLLENQLVALDPDGVDEGFIEDVVVDVAGEDIVLRDAVGASVGAVLVVYDLHPSVCGKLEVLGNHLSFPVADDFLRDVGAAGQKENRQEWKNPPFLHRNLRGSIFCRKKPVSHASIIERTGELIKKVKLLADFLVSKCRRETFLPLYREDAAGQEVKA